MFLFRYKILREDDRGNKAKWENLYKLLTNFRDSNLDTIG